MPRPAYGGVEVQVAKCAELSELRLTQEVSNVWT